MTAAKRRPSNVAASIHDRLLRLAKQSTQDFNTLLVRFASERLLYRLSKSRYADRFILKGAWLFYVWDVQRRVTRDVDLLGFGNANASAMGEVFRETLVSEVEPDGIEFDLARLEVAEIREGAAYPGLRVRVVARLGPARITCQVDVGFGDALIDEPVKAELPTLLDLPAPELRVYPVEALVAEKIEAIVRLGEINTRLKDYFDLYVLATELPLDAASLSRQFAETFERRGTPILPQEPVGLSEHFASDRERNARWLAFLDRSGAAAAVPTSFQEIVGTIRALILAPYESVAASRSG